MTAATDLVDAFMDQAAQNACTVYGPFSADAARHRIVEVVAPLAADGDGPAACADDDLLRALDVDAALASAGVPLLRPTDAGWREHLVNAPVGVTGASGAVAVTGSMLLPASAGAPRSISVVPPNHVCVVSTSTVVAELEDALHAFCDATALPSSLVWVSGPSRTSDLEMQPTIGVHGPIAVTVIMVAT